MLSLVLILSMASVVQAEGDELEVLNNPPKNHVYTEIALKVGKTEMTVFGYVDSEGTPQFRIYGKVGKTKGFFPITISNDGELVVENSEAVKDNKRNFGQAKIAGEKMDIPDGFVKTNKKNIFRMVNVFGETEHVAYASYDGQNYFYFPIGKNNQPLPGSFPMDIDEMLERSKKANNNKKVKKPAEFKNGFSKGIILITSEGGELKAFTAGPIVDIENLTAKKNRSFGFGSGGGHRGGSNSSSANGTVKFAQQILKSLGFLSGPVDGKLGAQTKKAISAFQGKNGLVQTGTLDKGTLAKMRGNTAVNAAGKTVLLKDISEAQDKAKAKAALPGLEAAVTISKGKLPANQSQTFTVKATKNPNGLSNFTYSLIVKGPEVFHATFNATGGSISHTFSTSGDYRVLLYINGPAGTIGADFKDFIVLGNNPSIPGNISQSDADADTYLQMTFGGSHNKPVEKGSNANIVVSIKPAIPGHNYTIAVSGPGYSDSVSGANPSFNKQVQSDGTAKDYTVTVTGKFNGATTNTITGIFKVLAGGTATPGTEYINLTYNHTGDVPSGVIYSETVEKGKTITKVTETKVLNGVTYTGTWNPSGSFTITEAKTFDCNWKATYTDPTVTLEHTGQVPQGITGSSFTVPYNSSYTPKYVDTVVNEVENGDGSKDRYTYTNNGWNPQTMGNVTSNVIFRCHWNLNIVQIQPPTSP